MTILHNLAALFAEDGIQTEVTERQILIPIRGGAYGTRIIITERDHMLRVRVSIPLFIPSLKTDAVREAIELVNSHVQCGSFILAEDGEVCFRFLLPVRRTPNEESEIKQAVLTAWRVVATHSTALVEVALGNRVSTTALDPPHKMLPLDLKEAIQPRRD